MSTGYTCEFAPNLIFTAPGDGRSSSEIFPVPYIQRTVKALAEELELSLPHLQIGRVSKRL